MDEIDRIEFIEQGRAAHASLVDRTRWAKRMTFICGGILAFALAFIVFGSLTGTTIWPMTISAAYLATQGGVWAHRWGKLVEQRDAATMMLRAMSGGIFP